MLATNMNLMGNDHFPGNPSYNANKDAECSSGSICTNQCMIPNGYRHAMYKSFIIISIYSKHTPRCLHKVKRNNNKPIKQVGIEESVWERTGQCEKLHRNSHEGESSQRGRLSRRCTSEMLPGRFFLTFQKGSSSCPRPARIRKYLLKLTEQNYFSFQIFFPLPTPNTSQNTFHIFLKPRYFLEITQKSSLLKY